MTPQATWEAMDNAAALIVEAGHRDARSPLVLAAAACARLALRSVAAALAEHPIQSLAAAETWARGAGAGAPPRLTDAGRGASGAHATSVRAAIFAAYVAYADDPTNTAATSVDSAVDGVAHRVLGSCDAAASRRAGATHYDVARREAHRAMAGLVRRHFPCPPSAWGRW